MRTLFIVLFTALFTVIVASAQDAKEAAMGAQLAREVRQRTTAIDNPALQDYVDRIGNRLAVALPDANFTYKFALIADESDPATHEPLSLPGGYIFVPASLLMSATDEAEFAAMLAHAMAHSTLPVLNSGTGTIPVIFIGGWQGQGLRSTLPMSALKTRRENEMRADSLAIQMMDAAGYNPEALVTYLLRVQPAPERSAKVFALLPDRDERIAALRQAFAELPFRIYADADAEEFRQMKDAVRNIAPSQDLVRPTLKRRN